VTALVRGRRRQEELNEARERLYLRTSAGIDDVDRQTTASGARTRNQRKDS
jgi:hypothetical protein